LYRTEIGEVKVTNPAERKLLAAAGLDLLEVFDDEDLDLETGVKIFDQILRDRKGLALLHMLQALLTDAPAPPLLAWTEATLYVLFENIRALVDEEITYTKALTLRPLLFEACMDPDNPDPMPGPDEREAWHELVDFLEEKYLWDTNFLEGSNADLSPEQQRDMGIAVGYFSSLAPDFKKDQEGLLKFQAELKKDFRQTA
jgi:hypothetical protein